jgi:hypothetical protein
MIKILKKIFSIFLLIFFFEMLEASVENKIVIKVGNKIITSLEIKNKINTELVLRNLEFNQSNINKMKKIAVQALIDSRIKEIEIEKYSSINLNNVDVSRQLLSISGKNIDALKKKFSENSLDYDIFLKELKLQNSWQKLIFTLFGDKIIINEDELIKELNIIKNENSNIKTYNLSEIEVSYDGDIEKEEQIKKIKQSIEMIGFDQTISAHSESLSATNNGQLGYISERSLSQEIFNNLKNLKKGNISDPIVQLNKIIFLKINEIKIIKNENFSLDLEKKRLINEKKNNLLKLYSQSHLSKIKNNSFIEFK